MLRELIPKASREIDVPKTQPRLRAMIDVRIYVSNKKYNSSVHRLLHTSMRVRDFFVALLILAAATKSAHAEEISKPRNHRPHHT